MMIGLRSDPEATLFLTCQRAVFLYVCTAPHRVPRGAKRHLYSVVTRGSAPGYGSQTRKEGRKVWHVSRRDRDDVPGVASTRSGTSPFRRSETPGTCAIRPARVDYGQRFGHARG